MMAKYLKGFYLFVLMVLWISLLLSCNKNNTARSYDIDLKSDRETVLMADIGLPSTRINAEIPTHGAKRFMVSDWSSPQDALTWFVNSYKQGKFAVTLLIKGENAQIELITGSKKLTKEIKNSVWDRIYLGEVNLNKGLNVLTIRAPKIGEKLELYSVELIDPEVQERQLKRAEEMRSDTKWMREAKYGLQFHWTSMSKPRTGPPKPSYAQAVQDFDVEAFAKLVHETGAGWIILTTSHGEYYFPAPIKSIDRIMPERTTSRDLVNDLYEALNQFGIRLMLYYHVGHDHYRELDGWWRRIGFDSHNPGFFFNNWCTILTEIGERYGTKLSGWFFDDGLVVYYPLNPDFERLAKAAKAGNPDRVICYNPWILPRATDFQDYLCGEGYNFLLMQDNLPADGSGILTAGPHQGLLAHTNFPLEGEWGHFQLDTPIPSPRVSKDQFVKDMTEAIQRGIAPSVNLSVYQDGTVSEESMAYMLTIKKMLGK